MRVAVLLLLVFMGCSKPTSPEEIEDGEWHKMPDGSLAIRPGYQKDGIRGFDVELIVNGDVRLQCRVADPKQVGEWCSYKDKSGNVFALRWTEGEAVFNVLNPSGGGKP